MNRENMENMKIMLAIPEEMRYIEVTKTIKSFDLEENIWFL